MKYVVQVQYEDKRRAILPGRREGNQVPSDRRRSVQHVQLVGVDTGDRNSIADLGAKQWHTTTRRKYTSLCRNLGYSPRIAVIAGFVFYDDIASVFYESMCVTEL